MSRERRGLVLCALALTCAFTLVVPAVADQIKGGFEHNERGRIDPTFAAAFPVRASFDADLRGIEVLLTPAAIDVEAAVVAVRPHDQAINQDALDNVDYITVMVWDDGDVTMNARYDRGNAQFIDTTEMQLRAELTVSTADRVAGRIWTESAVEIGDGETYSVDLTFDAPISRPPKSEPLPEGGGEPGRALAVAIEAAVAESWPELAPLLRAELRDAIQSGWSENDQERAVEIRDRFCQSSECVVVVTGGIRRVDGVADLDVMVQLEGYKAIHRARMVREGDRWLFDSTTMITIE